MASKKLVIFYHAASPDDKITTSDYGQFYEKLLDEKPDDSLLEVEDYPCIHPSFLITKVQQLIGSNYDELYFHFSGHGNEDGIPYRGWFLENNELASLVDEPKVKCCFFSSCRSSDLVDLVKQRDLPVVIGTSGANDIENRYAIRFQILFYLNLFAHKSFERAFESAKLTLKGLSKRKALDGLEVQDDSFFEGDPIVRGGGGAVQILEENNINSLQIVFAQDEIANSYLIEPNFLHRMEQAKENRLRILTWFDDSKMVEDFVKILENRGFDQLTTHINIPDQELEHLPMDKRGDDDPFGYGQTILLIGVSDIARFKSDLLRNQIDALRAHLFEDIWEMDQYKVVFLLKSGIELDQILPLLKDKDLNDHIVHFDQKPSELLDNPHFVDKIQNQKVDFAKRKEIILNFRTNPVKGEIAMVTDQMQFVRIFHANNVNEYLVNFLINWISFKDSLHCPVVLIDEHEQESLEFKDYLLAQMEDVTGLPKKIKSQFGQLFSDGCFIVLRKRSGGIEEWRKIIEYVLEEIEEALDEFAPNKLPTTPSYIFFLHDQDLDLKQVRDQHHEYLLSGLMPADDSNLVLKEIYENKKKFLERIRRLYHAEALSPPLPVSLENKEMIETWIKKFNDLEDEPQHVVDQILVIKQTLFEKLDQEQYVKCCPSAAINDICNLIEFPTKQITGT